MGYRSEVAYVIRFESKEVMDTFIGVQLVKKDKHTTDALKELEIVEDETQDQVSLPGLAGTHPDLAGSLRC